MTILFVRRVGNALQADGADSFDELLKLPYNKPLKAEVVQSRNLPHHKLFWTLCQRIGASIGVNRENIADLLKIECGHCTIIHSKKYGELRLPKSISFASMSQTDFNTFFEACVNVIYSEWGIERADVLASVADLLAPKTEQHA